MQQVNQEVLYIFICIITNSKTTGWQQSLIICMYTKWKGDTIYLIITSYESIFSPNVLFRSTPPLPTTIHRRQAMLYNKKNF